MAEVIDFQKIYSTPGDIPYSYRVSQFYSGPIIPIHLCLEHHFVFIQGYGYVDRPELTICPEKKVSSQSFTPIQLPNSFNYNRISLQDFTNGYQSLYKPEPLPWSERVSTLYSNWPFPYPPGDPAPWPDRWFDRYKFIDPNWPFPYPDPGDPAHESMRDRIFVNPNWQMSSLGHSGVVWDYSNMNVQSYMQPSSYSL